MLLKQVVSVQDHHVINVRLGGRIGENFFGLLFGRSQLWNPAWRAQSFSGEYGRGWFKEISKWSSVMELSFGRFND
jgi:hypothetical protein